MSILDTKQVLDHGYVRLVQIWGDDESIIEAARMSTQKGFQGWGGECRKCGGSQTKYPARVALCLQGAAEHDIPEVGDEKLLRFLYEHGHMTPFEMGGFTIEVQAPIFVLREWMRHRSAGYNEMSARYAPLPDVNYMPTVDRLMRNAGGSNKQAGTIAGAAALNEAEAQSFRESLAFNYGMQEALYQKALTAGVPKELARLCLPVGRYSRMRATSNLRMWLHFLTLRMSKDAQQEIREYAEAVSELVKLNFPRTHALFMEHAHG